MSNYGDYYEKTTAVSDLNELPPAENENQDNYIIHGCQPPWMDETNPYLNDLYWSQLQPDNSQSGTFMSLFDHQSHPFDHQSQPWHSQQFSGDGLHSYGPQPSHHSVTHVSNTLGENDTNDSGDSIYFKGNDAEPDYEYEISKLKDKIQESPNPHIRRSWFQKMKDVFTPGQSKTKEPVVRRDTRGRPTTKKPPTKSKANSTKVDPARHSSYTSSEHTVPTPGRHSSYIHGTTPIEPEFPSVLRPGDLVNVRRFRIYLPPWIYPFIKKIIDPKPDGNCGFRAIALALGKRENEWPWVREQMSLEMTKRRMFWSRRMNEELGGAYNSLLRAIEWGEIGPAKEGYWLDFPGHGLVVAQAFNCVVISINIYGSETYFPPVTSPDPLFQYPTITLANVHGCHWLELKLTEGHPIPNPTLYWPRYAGTNAPLWENMYREGRDKYDAIQYELRGSNPTSPVDLDPMGLM